MNIISIILVVVAVAGAIYFAFNYKTIMKTSNYEIIETRDFSCPGMKGFTFKYPVFRGWEVDEQRIIRDIAENSEVPEPPLATQNSCIIPLKYPATIQLKTGDIAPQIKVTKNSEQSSVIITSNYPRINSFGIPYSNFDAVSNAVSFYISDDTITVSISGFPENSSLYKQFFQTVIESFRLTK